MSTEQLITDLKAKIDSAQAEWNKREQEIQEEFKTRYDREFGFYIGRVDGWKETLKMLGVSLDNEEGEKNETPTEQEQDEIVNETESTVLD